MLTKSLSSGCGPGQPCGVQAHELDPLRDAGLDRVLQTRGVREEGDAVRLQRDGLVHAGEPGGRAAFPVNDGDVPPKLLRRLLDVDAVEMRNVVLFVARQEDDLLPGLRLRRLRRSFPRGLRAGVFCDRRLGVGDRVGEGRRDCQHACESNDGDGDQC